MLTATGPEEHEVSVAIVTGGASGIGAATARLLGREGLAVVVADIDDASGPGVVEEISALGGPPALFVKTDMSSPMEIELLIRRVIERYGRIDLLHNNAGLMTIQDSIEDISIEEWDKAVAVMLTGAFVATRSVFPIMREQGGGLIVHTASRGSWVPLPFAVHYASVKAGVLGLSRSVAAVGEPLGIRSNAICPGAVHSGLQRHAPASHLERLDRQGWIEPEDVARLVLHFVRAREATGEEILVEERAGRPAFLRALPLEFESFEPR